MVRIAVCMMLSRYTYIYTLDSHMAPYGASQVEQSVLRSSEDIPNMVSNVIANVTCNGNMRCAAEFAKRIMATAISVF